MTYEEYMDAMINELKNNITQLTPEQLEIFRQNLSIGVVVMDDLMQKYIPNNYTPTRSVLDGINQKNTDLRKAIIDEQRRRQ